MHREGTNPTYRSSYGSWISSKMYSCGSCFSCQNFGDVFPCTKKSMMKKRYVFAKKNVRGRDASTRSTHGHRIREMAQTRPHCPAQTDINQDGGSRTEGVEWMQVFVLGRRVHPYIDRALELALQVGPQLRKPTIGKPPPRPPRDG